MRFGFQVFAVLLGVVLPVFAQSDRGTVTGTVKDTSGAVVPGARVVATNRATNNRFRTNSTSTGDFTITALPVGKYQLRVENEGFMAYVADDVQLSAGGTIRLDVELQVGSAQQSIEVSAAAQMLQAETARVATEVSNRLVDQLPVVVNGGVRSPFDLASITPEVSTAGSTNTSSNFRIGGGRAGAWGMTLDGTAITVASQMSTNGQTWTQVNTPSVEALTEFAVESGGFKAESGHASGGTTSFVSKSGTNEFHGSAYEFLRNEALDARGFFATKKPIYKQNDFGVTAGGHVVLPKIYNGRDKTFFFFSYEGFRNRVGASPTPYSIPPQEFYSGDLSSWVDQNNKQIQVYDPSTQRLVNGTYVRDPFPNNQIPQARIDPVAKSIINYVQPLLKANVAGLAPGTSGYVRNNYVSYGTSMSPSDKTSIKGDQLLTDKQRVSFFYGHNKQTDDYGANGPTGLPKPLSGNPGYNKSDVYRGSYDYTLKPTLLNRLYAGVNMWQQNHGSYATYKDAPQSMGIPTVSEGWKSKGICVPNYPDCNANFPMVVFSNSEFTTWGNPAPNGSDNIVWEIRDDMTKISGRHTFKWGYYYNNTHYNGFGLQNIAGNMTFSQLSTSIPLNTSLASGGGSGFAAFLLGQVSGYSLDTPRYIATHYRTHQMFFQDDWRITPRLTLNLGLRYEINMAPMEGTDQLSDLDMNLANPAAGGIKGALRFAGSGPGREGRRSLIDNWFGGIGPRLGFSYTVNSKTSIRGAATRSYGPVVGVGSATHNLGFVVRNTVSDTSQGLNPLWSLQDGPPAWTKPPLIDPSVGNGQNVAFYNGDGAAMGSGDLTYSFNIQRQLTSSTVLEAGYLGTLSSHIESTLLRLNQLAYRDLPANLSPFTASGKTILNSLVGQPTANAAGIVAPFSNFNTLWGSGATVAQALRPFPQYSTIDTSNGGGDRIGHSTYHSMMLKFQKRYAAGLTFQASYMLSKLLTDADAQATGMPMDNYNRQLEKSIASYDQTHSFKTSYVYELPFGPGRKYLTQKGVTTHILGGWRVSGIQEYASGVPLGLTTTVSFPIFGGNHASSTTYDGWRAPLAGGDFDPNADRFLQQVSYFGTQPTDRFGNLTRYNPKARTWPTFNENISLAKTFNINEPVRLDFRFEAFNLLNRTQFGPLTGGSSIQNANFGLWRAQTNSGRRMQIALKLYW